MRCLRDGPPAGNNGTERGEATSRQAPSLPLLFNSCSLGASGSSERVASFKMRSLWSCSFWLSKFSLADGTPPWASPALQNVRESWAHDFILP